MLQQRTANQIFNFISSTISYFTNYPVFVNLGTMWNYGFLATIFLALQIITGFLLSTHYVPDADYAFLSVERIMRDVHFGWLLRYLHANGASFLFFLVYLHVLRSIYYASYTGPRKETWTIGVIIFILLIVTAFTGYVLPWGQMSFWAATVITNLFSAIPIFGSIILEWLWGGYSVNTFTLSRFYSIHFVTPFIILALVALHIVLLHEHGGNNKFLSFVPADKFRFFPFYLIKDIYFFLIFFIIYSLCVGFSPNYLLHPDNYLPADPKTTPTHIVPEWYFSLFYAILRSIPSKLLGICFLVLSLLVFFVMPYLHATYILSIENYFNWARRSLLFFVEKRLKPFKPLFKINWETVLFWYFLVVCIILGILGAQPLENPYLLIGRIFTLLYFSFFFFKFFLLKTFYHSWLVDLLGDTNPFGNWLKFFDRNRDSLEFFKRKFTFSSTEDVNPLKHTVIQTVDAKYTQEIAADRWTWAELSNISFEEWEEFIEKNRIVFFPALIFSINPQQRHG